ncbi:MAG: fibronectin type III domain-containing protein [Bacteroidota bacterium]
MCCIPLFGRQLPERKGWWKFDDTTNIVKAEAGSPLMLNGRHTLVPGPKQGNGAVRIGNGSYYAIRHGMHANGGGSRVNQYTILIDLKVPVAGAWKSLFQTDLSNTSDGDFFINTNENIGIQPTGYTSYAVIPNEWYRFVLTVQNGVQQISYLDGEPVNEGGVLPIDGRFALDSLLLMFADNDGENAEIDCAEIAIWDTVLTAEEVAALGGFGHNVHPKHLPIVPYLQAPTPTSVYVCWHDTSTTGTRVEYGTSASLGMVVTGNSERIAIAHRWHTVLLTGLKPDTEYFYRVKSSSDSSAIFTMRTQPAYDFTGKIRFLMISDTHNSDTAKSMRVITAARQKISELYGEDIHNQINAVLHSGDLVIFGRNAAEYSKLFFAPMSVVSASIPFLTVPGNHDRPDNGRDGDAGVNYYTYTKYDDISLKSAPDPLAERIWSARFANTLVIGINTDIAASLGAEQAQVLDKKLAEAQADTSIDFVTLLTHHMPVTELWGEAIGYDSGPRYVRNVLLPILQKYSKVVQLTYGHTHGFERGTIESKTNGGDFRIVCNGGGGGDIDRWGAFKNYDHQNIHVTLDHFCFQIVEIDIAHHSYTGTMYSLGNSDRIEESKALDSWYRKARQPAPAAPIVSAPTIVKNRFVFHSTPVNGHDSLMTVRLQIAYDTSFIKIALDTMMHWKNVYGRDSHFNPIDKNKGIELTNLQIPVKKIAQKRSFYYRVKYRDHNLRWSDWSRPSTKYEYTSSKAKRNSSKKQQPNSHSQPTIRSTSR